SLAHRAELVDVAEHVGERHHRVDDLRVAARIGAGDLAAPRVDVADHRAKILLRRHHLDLHDRLEQHRARLLQRVAEGLPRADLEGERRRIDIVIGAVDQGDAYVDHREADQHARGQNRLQALLDAGDVLLRHRATDDLGLEVEALARRVRMYVELDAGELAGAAGLFLVRIVLDDGAGDGFAIGDLRPPDTDVDLIGPL